MDREAIVAELEEQAKKIVLTPETVELLRRYPDASPDVPAARLRALADLDHDGEFQRVVDLGCLHLVENHGGWHRKTRLGVVWLRLHDRKPEPSYPEHEKQRAVIEHMQEITSFVEEFLQEKGVELAEYRGHYAPTDHLVSVKSPVQELIAEFYGINLKVIEQERRQMLDAMGAGS